MLTPDWPFACLGPSLAVPNLPRGPRTPLRRSIGLSFFSDHYPSLPEFMDFILFGKTILVVNKKFGLFLANELRKRVPGSKDSKADSEFPREREASVGLLPGSLRHRRPGAREIGVESSFLELTSTYNYHMVFVPCLFKGIRSIPH